MYALKLADAMLFLSTLSLRRATLLGAGVNLGALWISIHALLAESDLTNISLPEPCYMISIHALLAESDRTPTTVVTLICISIHALLAESDSAQGASNQTAQQISIHALLAESDP